jgi:hypothetical protein
MISLGESITLGGRPTAGFALGRTIGLLRHNPAHAAGAPISFGGIGMLGFTWGGPRSEMYAGEYMEAASAGHPEAGWAGQTLTSPNGAFRLEMQSDGNLVIYGPGGAVLRSWGQHGGRTTFNMQTDGNLVLYNNGRPAWAADTNGRGGNGRVVMQDDGNLVLYFGGAPAWSSETNGGKQYSPGGLAHTLTSVASAIGGAVAPVAHLVTAPVSAAVHIARGDNVLSTLGNHFKDQVKNIKDVAPMAQAVVSFVPGVGSGVNAAIAAGSALAQGANISDALVSAAKNALPGGPIAAAAFDTAYKLGKAAATGGNIGQAALEAARAQLPGPVAQQAFDTALAIAHGQNVQQAITSGAVNVAKSQLPALVPSVPFIPALPSSVTHAASTVASAINALPPQVKSVATALFNQPGLRGLPVAQAAQVLGSDVATVNRAVAALSAIHPTTVLQVRTPALPMKPAALPARAVAALPRRPYPPYAAA